MPQRFLSASISTNPSLIGGITQHHSGTNYLNTFTYSSLITFNYFTKPSSFGVVLEEREFSSSSYRYGFNGQEKDDEMKGQGNSVNFEFRMLDTRIGRFLSVDPLTRGYPMLTPYQYASNNPIMNVDLEGLEGTSATGSRTVTPEQAEELKSTHRSNPSDGTMFDTGSLRTYHCPTCPSAGKGAGNATGEFFNIKPNKQVSQTANTGNPVATGAPIPQAPNVTNGQTSMQPNSPVLTAADQANLAALIPPIGVAGFTPIGAATVDAQPTENLGLRPNSEGYLVPQTTQTTTSVQPGVITQTGNATQMTVTVNLQTSVPGATGTALLNNRFTAIQNYYVATFGIPAANIVMGTMTTGVPQGTNPNNNLVQVTVNQPIQIIPAQQTTVTTTTSTYEY